MASTAEQILDLKRQAIALKDAGDTNGAMALLAQARDLEFENASVDDLWDVIKLKQFAVVMKKRGDLDAARQALIKAKQVEKEGLTPPAEGAVPSPEPQAPTPPEPSPAPPKEETPAITIKKENPPAPQEEPVVEGNDTTTNNDDDDLKELMQLDQPNDSPVDVAFSVEEMADQEMMTEFKLGGMPVPSDEEYQTKILDCKKAALAAKKAGDTTLALKELGKSKQLEKVRLALAQMAGGDNNNELGGGDDAWMHNLNAEESALLGELMPNNNNNKASEEDMGLPSDTPAASSSDDRIEDVLEELAGFLEDPALFMDALDMGMEVPSVQDVEAKAEEYKLNAVEHKKAGNLEGAKAALIKCKQFTAHATKLRAVLDHVERKKGGGGGGEVKLEDLEAMLEADENKGKQVPKAATQPAKPAAPAVKTSDQLRAEAIKLRDQKKIKEAGEVLKLYKVALQREKDAAEMKRRQELVNEIRKEIDFAQHQIRIFEYYQRYCDADTQQVAWWKEYITRCSNASKVILAKGTEAIKIARKKTTMMSARQEGLDEDKEEDFNRLIMDLLDRGTNSDPPDERLEITIQTFDKIQDNTNLQKLFKKQKRENLPEHPAILRLDVHVQLPPNEHDTEKSIELVFEPASSDPLKKLELTTEENGAGGESQPSTCVYEKSQYVDLVRGNSAYGKILRRRIERNKKITITAYHVPVAEKKGWFFSKKNKEELPPPTLLGKVVLEMQGLMTKKCCAAGEYPLVNGSGTKELGGVLKLAVRTGVPITQPGERDEEEEADPIRTKLEPYTAMVFSLNKEEAPSTAAEI